MRNRLITVECVINKRLAPAVALNRSWNVSDPFSANLLAVSFREDRGDGQLDIFASARRTRANVTLGFYRVDGTRAPAWHWPIVGASRSSRTHRKLLPATGSLIHPARSLRWLSHSAVFFIACGKLHGFEKREPGTCEVPRASVAFNEGHRYLSSLKYVPYYVTFQCDLARWHLSELCRAFMLPNEFCPVIDSPTFEILFYHKIKLRQYIIIKLFQNGFGLMNSLNNNVCEFYTFMFLLLAIKSRLLTENVNISFCITYLSAIYLFYHVFFLSLYLSIFLLNYFLGLPNFIWFIGKLYRYECSLSVNSTASIFFQGLLYPIYGNEMSAQSANA